jgi:rSAM/selenodomain-associated transferase 1
MAKELLIIFVKTAIDCKVKTRLATSVGKAKALSVYNKLVKKTHEITVGLPQEKWVAYSGSITMNDVWGNNIYNKIQQRGSDLGQKMSNAFNDGFDRSYQHICLIGSDIFELSDEIIKQAFFLLKDNDLVLGPTKDGGYYLIGMKKLQRELFEDIPWSTSEVLQKTIDTAEKLDLNTGILPKLSDIDTLEDIREEDRDFLLS